MRAQVSIGAKLSLKGRSYVVRIKDLSASGAYLSLLDQDRLSGDDRGTLVAEPFGEPINVALRRRFPSEGMVEGLGVEFVDVPDETRTRIRALVERHAAARSQRRHHPRD